VSRSLKALVTGATGFIGSHLVEDLLQRGIHVRCLVRKTSDLKWLRDLPIDPVYGDCNDPNSLGEAVKGVDQVFHLAGVTKAIQERTYFEVNAFGTENLIHACLEHNSHLQKFIYLSSQAAAGPCRDGGMKRESDISAPVSPYGKSKRMGEELAMEHSHELPLLILRPCAIYGPRDRDIYAFFKLLSKRIKPCLSGQDQHISLCFVQDIIQAILLAAEARQPSGEVFFVSDGHGYRLEEIGDIFAINKADLDGADRRYVELEMALGLDRTSDGWEHPIIKVIATTGEGVEELVKAIQQHHEYLVTSGKIKQNQERRFCAQLETIVEHSFMRKLFVDPEERKLFQKLVQEVCERKTDPYTAAERLILQLIQPQDT